MTSPSQPTTMRSSTNNKTPPSDLAIDDNAFVLQPDVTLSDETARLTMATSTSLSATTPRTSRLLSHEPAHMMETATVLDTFGDTKHLTYTADVKQFSESMDCVTKSATTQSSQLDSMLLSKLPRELRDKVYRDAVVEDKDIPIRVTAYVTKVGERRRRLEIGHALLRACKQTRDEVAKMYYLENTFRVTDDLFDFEKRAIRELNRFLTPWAGKMTKLGVSHTSVRTQGDPAKINFSISASQGRIVVEPEPSSVNHLIYLGRAMTRPVTITCHRICFCKTSKLAFEHDGHDVLSWMQKYVDLVLQPESLSLLSDVVDTVHCWTCASRNVI